jgi:aminoglycoside phosphotransferase (APT) family kinase protein
VSLDAALPADFRGPTTTITKVSAGLSGAGVYRVEAGGRAFVLKISDADAPFAGWRGTLEIQRLAADAGLAPKIVHVDEGRRAVVSEFVVDRSFPALYIDPRTRDAAIAQLGRTVRHVHALPVPPDVEAKDPRDFLATIWAGLAPNVPLPAFVGDAVSRVLSEQPPTREGDWVLSHNDLNPSNIVYDGERLLLLDWDAAAPNDPHYDLAVVALFLRMDEATCLGLLAAHDGAPVAAPPAAFTYNRRLAGVLAGANFLNLARQSGHAGATGAETLDSTPSLADFYQRMRAGEVNLATGDGQWAFGLSLVKEGEQ